MTDMPGWTMDEPIIISLTKQLESCMLVTVACNAGSKRLGSTHHNDELRPSSLTK